MPNVLFLALRRLRGPLITLICVYALSVLGLVLIPGVDDQGNLWRMDFFHAFYFVSFMGSTIGFGEVPYPFTPGQRLWVLLCIYTTVSAWLFAIGRALALFQDPAFRQATTLSAFRRSVRHITEEFYVVCGYGDTGRLLVRGLADRGFRSTVVDNDQERINLLTLEDLRVFVPGLRADASDPSNLVHAGLQHPRCAGVIATTNSDHVNLKVAISSKLLNPELPVICRSEIHDVGINMESFGTDEIINPFDIFADRLAMAVESPARYAVTEWLTSHADTPLTEPVCPPKGPWVLCGYGRFGKAVEQFLSFQGIEATIIEANPKHVDAPEDCIVGRGTEAVTLQEGGIEQAVGIIAGTDDDANNLSIIMTARELKPSLFTVARQNQQENDAIFGAAEVHLVMQRSDLIARRILTMITKPLLAEFLEKLHDNDDDQWANTLAARIIGVAGNHVPVTWVLSAKKSRASALAIALFQGHRVMLRQLVPRADPPLRCLALMLKRGTQVFLLPNPGTELELGDRVLFCGTRYVRGRVLWTANNSDSLRRSLAENT